ncbi:MAG: polysaccharide biosynthesis C-terminal domain-containing protein, partial [Candidatus Azambacteria bacterium]|nr:polysaccharide biosynthesis C-terminal domain-containing protein [Candidatus Azambacteria bacterium]
LIPKYSFYGAAFASCVTQLLIFFLLFIFTLKFTSIRFPDLRFLIFLAQVFVSGAVMSIVLSMPQVYYLNVFLAIIIGIISYGISIFTLQFIRNRFSVRISYEKLSIS